MLVTVVMVVPVASVSRRRVCCTGCPVWWFIMVQAFSLDTTQHTAGTMKLVRVITAIFHLLFINLRYLPTFKTQILFCTVPLQLEMRSHFALKKCCITHFSLYFAASVLKFSHVLISSLSAYFMLSFLCFCRVVGPLQ